MSVKVQFFVLLGVCQIVCKLRPVEEELTREMRLHLTGARIHYFIGPDTLGFIGTYGSYTRAMMDCILRYRSEDSMIRISGPYVYPNTIFNDSSYNLFCFLETENDFGEIMKLVDSASFFHRDGYVNFVVGRPVHDKDWVLPKLEYIWDNDILNFALAFQYKSTVELVTYNPFERTCISAEEGFNKMRNMHRFQWNVGMIDEYPRNVLKQGKLQGPDVIRLKEIANYLNASVNLTVYKTRKDLGLAIQNRQIHFSTTKFFLVVNDTEVVQPNYPINLNYLVILVPSAKLIHHSQYLLRVFEPSVLLSVLLVYLLMYAMFHFFSYQTRYTYASKVETLFTVPEILLGHPYAHIRHVKSHLKIVVITWIAFSMLLNIGFNTALRKSLVRSKYEHEIETFQDLVDSDLQVYAHRSKFGHVMNILKPIHDRVIDVETTADVAAKAMKPSRRYAYTLFLDYAEDLARKRDRNGRRVFRILKQYIVPGIDVYNFARNSPYQQIFDNLVQTFQQFGYSQFGKIKVPSYSAVTNARVSMSLTHLQGVFFIWICGAGGSSIAFSVELLVYKNRAYILRDLIVKKIRHGMLVLAKTVEEVVSLAKEKASNIKDFILEVTDA